MFAFDYSGGFTTSTTAVDQQLAPLEWTSGVSASVVSLIPFSIWQSNFFGLINNKAYWITHVLYALISAEEEEEETADDADEAQAEPRPRGTVAAKVSKQVALLISEGQNAVENFELFDDRIKRKVKVLTSCFYWVTAIKTLNDTELMNFLIGDLLPKILCSFNRFLTELWTVAFTSSFATCRSQKATSQPTFTCEARKTCPATSTTAWSVRAFSSSEGKSFTLSRWGD